MKVLIPASLILILTYLTTTWAQEGPEGVLIYHEPLASYTEAMEYQAFQHDNALYCTVVTVKNERKQLKSGSVIAVVPYPPATFEPVFEETANTALRTIDSLIGIHPQVKTRLEVAKEKWSQALAVFREIHKTTPPSSRQRSEKGGMTLPAGARLSRATPDTVTIAHTTGVSTIRLRELTPTQVLLLNSTSRTIQLPLGTDTTSPPAKQQPESSGMTRRLELSGRAVVARSARALGTDYLTFSVWTFFAFLPGLAVVLLIMLFFSARRPRRGIFPSRRPLS